MEDKVMEESKPVIGLSLYQLNQQIVNGLNPMSEDDVMKSLTEIALWMSIDDSNKYFMLHNEFMHYYTILHLLENNYEKAIQEVKGILEFMGPIMSIDYCHERDYYELWVKVDGESHMFLFFRCDPLVVEVE